MSSKTISEALSESKSVKPMDLYREICKCLQKNNIKILEERLDEIVIDNSNITKKEVKNMIYSNLDILALVPQYILSCLAFYSFQPFRYGQ